MQSQFKRLGRNSFIYGLNQVALPALRFIVVVPILTRYLTPVEYGAFAVAITILAIFQILFDLNLRGAILRFRFEYLDNVSEFRRFVGTIAIFVAFSSLFLFLAGLVTGQAIISRLIPEVSFRLYIRPVLLCAAFLSLEGIILFLYRAREEALKYVTLTGSLFLLSSVLSLYFVLIHGEGAIGFLKGMVIASGCFFLLHVWLLRSEASIKLSLTHLKTGLKYSLPLLPMALMTWIITLSDRILIARFLNLDDVAIYSVAFNIGSAVGMLVFGVFQASTPFYFSIAGGPDRIKKKVIPLFATYFLFVASFATILFSMFAREALQVLTAEPYWSAHRIISFICLGYFINAVYFLSTMGVMFVKKNVWLLIGAGSAVLINVSLNLILIPLLGVEGAVIATLFSYTAQAVFAFFLSQKVHYVKYENERLLKLMAVLGLSFVLTVFMNNLPITYGSIAGKVAILIMATILLLSLGFLNEGEKIEIRKFAKSLPYIRGRV